MDKEQLKSEIVKYWTEKRRGNYVELAEQHDLLLTKYLKVNPADLFEQIYENKFIFQPFSKIKWSEFLKSAKLAEYLQPEYVDAALRVASARRPAIGKGEFLLVSCFSNLGFTKNKGDLIDLNNGKKCEIKGMRSTLSGDNNRYYQMNKSLMYSIYSLFDTGAHFDHFNRECAKELDEMLKTKPKLIKKVLGFLQNIRPADESLAEYFVELYNTKPDLFITVGAMQLFTYMYLQDASYLMMVDNDGFCCFEKPETVFDAQKIIANLNLSSWETGDYGMLISMKNEENN